jgi:GrpB-like predicted nucleotidyltransferase (UPF0157 family)
MLAEVAAIDQIDSRNRFMVEIGYEVMGEFGILGRRYFRKDNAAGFREYQVHAFASGSPDVDRHLAFRDYLRAKPDVAHEYSELKRRLADKHPDDMEAYMDGKDAFIKEAQRLALEWRRSA